MKKIILISCIFLTSCYYHDYTYENNAALAKVAASVPEPKKPDFLGWDENGHKKLSANDDSKINNNLEFVHEPIAIENKLKKDKGAIPKTKSVILNEDTILCETDTPLLNIPMLFPYNTGISTTLITGTDLIKLINDGLESQESSLNRDYSFKTLLLTQYTEHGYYDGAGINRSDKEIEKKKKELEEYKKAAMPFLKLCTINKEVQPVEIIEIKPISPVAKIKVNVQNNSYELWTYKSHLTFN